MKKLESISKTLFQKLGPQEMKQFMGGAGSQSDCQFPTNQGSNCPDTYRRTENDDGEMTCEDYIDCNGNIIDVEE